MRWGGVVEIAVLLFALLFGGLERAATRYTGVEEGVVLPLYVFFLYQVIYLETRGVCGLSPYATKNCGLTVVSRSQRVKRRNC